MRIAQTRIFQFSPSNSSQPKHSFTPLTNCLTREKILKTVVIRSKAVCTQLQLYSTVAPSKPKSKLTTDTPTDKQTDRQTRRPADKSYNGSLPHFLTACTARDLSFAGHISIPNKFYSDATILLNGRNRKNVVARLWEIRL